MFLWILVKLPPSRNDLLLPESYTEEKQQTIVVCIQAAAAAAAHTHLNSRIMLIGNDGWSPALSPSTQYKISQGMITFNIHIDKPAGNVFLRWATPLQLTRKHSHLVMSASTRCPPVDLSALVLFGPRKLFTRSSRRLWEASILMFPQAARRSRLLSY